MKKSLKNVLAGLLIVPALVLGVAAFAPVATPVSAQSSIQNGAGSTNSDSFVQSLDGDNGVFKTIVNTALYIIGAISVLMLIYGGIRYTLSAGQTANVEAAKNTILYAIIGIIVAVLAYAIVNFVLGTLIGN